MPCLQIEMRSFQCAPQQMFSSRNKKKILIVFRKNMLLSKSYSWCWKYRHEKGTVNCGGGATNCHTLVVSLKIIVKPVSFASGECVVASYIGKCI